MCPKCGSSKVKIIRDIPWETVRKDGTKEVKGGTRTYACKKCGYIWHEDYA